MKCVQYSATGSIERISDDKASKLVKDGMAVFVPKSTWKKEVRDAN